MICKSAFWSVLAILLLRLN